MKKKPAKKLVESDETKQETKPDSNPTPSKKTLPEIRPDGSEKTPIADSAFGRRI